MSLILLFLWLVLLVLLITNISGAIIIIIITTFIPIILHLFYYHHDRYHYYNHDHFYHYFYDHYDCNSWYYFPCSLCPCKHHCLDHAVCMASNPWVHFLAPRGMAITLSLKQYVGPPTPAVKGPNNTLNGCLINTSPFDVWPQNLPGGLALPVMPRHV